MGSGAAIKIRNSEDMWRFSQPIQYLGCAEANRETRGASEKPLSAESPEI